MGCSGRAASAIDGAFEVIRALKRLEQRLLAEASQDPDFGVWERPVQLVISSIAGGEWHGSVPCRCDLQGNLGFLPDRSLDDAQALLRDALGEAETALAPATIELDFPLLRSDGYLDSCASPVVRQLAAACEAEGLPSDGRPWLVSCDARHYALHAGLPTAIFGCGRLEHAHSEAERVSIDELERGVAVLVRFLEAEASP
jgi:acetylornithine deacetylase